MSQLYSRVFLKILESSIAEDWQVRLVFEDLLKLASQDGVVDMTKTAISRRTNVPLAIVERGIAALESPDPDSRDPEHQGRRIVRLDGHRDWGWYIVNWDKYDAIRCAAEAREKERVRKRNARERAKSLDLPSALPSSEADTDTDTTTESLGHFGTQRDMSHLVPDKSGTFVQKPLQERGTRKRDEAFEALAELEGGHKNLTKGARGSVNFALAQIRERHPDVTRAEIESRIAEYRRTMPRGALVTAAAIGKNWARLGMNTQAQQMNLVSHSDEPLVLPGGSPLIKAVRANLAKPASERPSV